MCRIIPQVQYQGFFIYGFFEPLKLSNQHIKFDVLLICCRANRLYNIYKFHSVDLRISWFKTCYGTCGTVCPGGSDPIYIVSYFIECVTTSWTHSMIMWRLDYYNRSNIGMTPHFTKKSVLYLTSMALF